jgi:hypothetical protein
VEALDKFADTRAKFSQEASGGNMTEANVDIRGCDFSNMDLSSKVGLPGSLFARSGRRDETKQAATAADEPVVIVM